MDAGRMWGESVLSCVCSAPEESVMTDATVRANDSEVSIPAPKDPEMAFGTATAASHEPRLLTPDTDLPGANQRGLSRAEIDHFREFGYVVKRGLIPPATFDPFLDMWWRQPPVQAAGLRPTDPGTWAVPGRSWPEENRWSLAQNWMGHGIWPSPDDARTGADPGERVGRLPHKLTRDVGNDVWRWHGLGHDPEFVDATSAHPNLMHMAEALMGGPIKRPRRNRGIYSIFPRNDESPVTNLGPHMDQSMTELMVVTYVTDVEPRSGGFTIFPGSPQKLYPTSGQALNWVATDGSSDAMDDIKANIQPVEFVGRAGDVIFCHGLMVHSAGLHETGAVRRAVIQDLNRVRERSHMRWTAAGKHGGPRVSCSMDGFFRFDGEAGDDDPADGLREVTNQWIMDSNEFVRARHPPLEDMFAEWNLGQRDVTGHVVAEPPWWEKYGLPMLPSGTVERGGGGVPAVSLSSIASYEGDGVWRVASQANGWMDA
jgi:hypothetical protein